MKKQCQEFLHRRCVNPEHLELVSPRENVTRGQTIPAKNLRKTHCPRGHAYDAVDPRTGWRQCRTCSAMLRREERRAAGAWEADGPVCKRGHLWTPENTYITSKGHRSCRECSRQGQRNRRARRDDLAEEGS